MNIAVIGLGKLGGVLAAVCASAGHKVYGVDLDHEVVHKINRGKAPIKETGLQELMGTLPRESLFATAVYSEAIPFSDLSFIVVPTPSDLSGRFDPSYVIRAVSSILKNIPQENPWHTIVICSTIMPGTIDKEILPLIEKNGRTLGVDIGLVYSPEFIALGSVIHDMTHPDMVLLGCQDTRSSIDVAMVLSSIIKNEPSYHQMSFVSAEIAKISVNSYITMKISFANTLAEICEGFIGTEVEKIAYAIGKDQRIGNKYLNPGASFGGPCFPRDNVAFQKAAEEAGVTAPLAEATDLINNRQVDRIVQMIDKYDRIAVLGLAYKPGTPVTEESFGVRLIEALSFSGIRIRVYDPLVYQRGIDGVVFCNSAESALENVEAVVIATPDIVWHSLDFRNIPVFDCWGILPDNHLPKIYWKIGLSR